MVDCEVCKRKIETINMIFDDYVRVDAKYYHLYCYFLTKSKVKFDKNTLALKYRERENIFNSIMKAMREMLYDELNLDEHRKFREFKDKSGYIPVLSVNPETKIYRFNCYCFECPNNQEGLCRTEFSKLPLNNTYILHEFDNDNIVRNYCG